MKKYITLTICRVHELSMGDNNKTYSVTTIMEKIEEKNKIFFFRMKTQIKREKIVLKIKFHLLEDGFR